MESENKFQIVKEFLGYTNKKDITNTDPRFLVPPSQNVLINDGEKIAVRTGYTLDGVASTTLTPIQSSYDWNTSTGTETNLRSYDDELEYRYVASDNTVTWRRLKDAFSSVAFNFTEFWSSSESKDLLLFGNGDANIYEWSGGVTTFASATVNTITKQGTNTWGEDRFLLAGTRSVVIGGTSYTYTGGEGTTTLTGVAPDPTLGGHAAGAIIHQAVRTNANIPAAAFDNDLLATLNNYVFVGDTQRRDVYVSKNTSFTDYTFTAARLPGEGALLTLDSPPIGFVVQEDVMYISGSKNEWYQVVFQLSADLTKETVLVKRLKTGPGQGAVSQSAIGNAKNIIIYFSNERYIDYLGRVEQISTPQSIPLSDPIKADLSGYLLTVKPHIKYFKNQTFIAIPSEGLVLIYDHEKGYWQSPQVLPVRRFAVIGNELYGHSNAVPETYKLYVANTYNDNTNPINAIASFAYRSYGLRTAKKRMDEYFTEGYITPNTRLTMTLKYDFQGSTTIVRKIIVGDDAQIIFALNNDNSLGKNPLGSVPLGTVAEEVSDLYKFRVVKELTPTAVDFYEVNTQYESNDVDFRWEILAQGGNATVSTSDNTDIKQ